MRTDPFRVVGVHDSFRGGAYSDGDFEIFVTGLGYLEFEGWLAKTVLQRI